MPLKSVRSKSRQTQCADVCSSSALRLLEVAAVEAAGERIAHAHLLELRLELLARADVAHQRAHAARLARQVDDDRALGLGREAGAVAPAHQELAQVLASAARVAGYAALGIAALQHRRHLPARPLVLAVVEEVARVQPHRLLGRAAEHLAGDAVHEGDAIGREVALDVGVGQVEAQLVELVPQRLELGPQPVDLARGHAPFAGGHYRPPAARRHATIRACRS